MQDGIVNNQPQQAFRTDSGGQHILRIDPPTFYANNVALKTSIFDMTMVFGVMAEVQGDVLAVTNVATVIVSPQHAKAIAALLTNHVEEYERQFGALPTPLSPPAKTLPGNEEN